MFKDLKGIEKEREEKEREHNLEKLIETVEKTIIKYKGIDYIKETNCHNKIYAHLKDLQFDEADLKAYVQKQSFEECEDELVKKIIRGHITGCLLQLLTERNREKGKITRFYINGEGNKFDYLFYHASEVDDLIVDNFKGEEICSSVGARGRARSVTVLNCEGGFNVASKIGSNEGSAELLILHNNKGHNQGMLAGHNGKIGLLIATKNKGNTLTSNVGATGYADILLLSHNEGDQPGHMAASFNGNMNRLYVLDHKGDNTASSFCAKQGTIEKAIIANQEGEGAAETSGMLEPGNLKKLILYNAKKIRHSLAQECIEGIEAEEEYQKEMKKYRVAEMVSLTESLSGKTPDEMFAISDKIKEIYDEVKNVQRP
jgi:hypothetical protein